MDLSWGMPELDLNEDIPSPFGMFPNRQVSGSPLYREEEDGTMVAHPMGMDTTVSDDDKDDDDLPPMSGQMLAQGKKGWDWGEFGAGVLSTAVPGLIGGLGTLGTKKSWNEGAMPAVQEVMKQRAAQEAALQKQRELYQLKMMLPQKPPTKPSGIQEFEYYQGLDRAKQQQMLEFKNAGKMMINPFQEKKFEADEAYRRWKKDFDERQLIANQNKAMNKPLSSEAASKLQMAQEGIIITQKLRKKIEEGNTLMGAGLPYGLGDIETRKDLDNLNDIITRNRSGAAVRERETEIYSNINPNWKDSKAAKLRALDLREKGFRTVMGAILAGRENPEFQEDIGIPSIQGTPQDKNIIGKETTSIGGVVQPSKTPSVKPPMPDQDLIDWAQSHRDDPRSEIILKNAGLL